MTPLSGPLKQTAWRAAKVQPVVKALDELWSKSIHLLPMIRPDNWWKPHRFEDLLMPKTDHLQTNLDIICFSLCRASHKSTQVCAPKSLLACMDKVISTSSGQCTPYRITPAFYFPRMKESRFTGQSRSFHLHNIIVRALYIIFLPFLPFMIRWWPQIQHRWGNRISCSLRYCSTCGHQIQKAGPHQTALPLCFHLMSLWVVIVQYMQFYTPKEVEKASSL